MRASFLLISSTLSEAWESKISSSLDSYDKLSWAKIFLNTVASKSDGNYSFIIWSESSFTFIYK